MRWALLLFRWLGRSGPLERLDIVMYTRRGCHLCEAAWQLLEREQRRYGFRLTAVDVDSDPELAARYGLEVPVVAVNGRVRFRGGVNPVLLRRLLRAAARATGPSA
ncbi:MAG TPA: glutaredoxin family protein [Gemmataceae bacterium]|nr:glutaredoxin family protein [Gemmataceae bacterium]